MSTTPKDYTFKYDKKPFKVRDGEPWFVVRAQDKLSPETIQFYADLLKRESDKAFASGDETKGNELLKQALGVIRVASAFTDWQLDNKELVKLPD
jgi:hypothetical protein